MENHIAVKLVRLKQAMDEAELEATAYHTSLEKEYEKKVFEDTFLGAYILSIRRALTTPSLRVSIRVITLKVHLIVGLGHLHA
ncbi:hypothetical protein AXF42_Ash010430 [Apostasia shenzhenica]|uniref:Uncharacterized protein n=1 Tax=Apostasia shenzhenica TaxID=1088818 RepID=A0A2I0BE02_9ASPA|nr:hypothetical protein AXF42_Ash010430 [Apostasia shenzhenica]